MVPYPYQQNNDVLAIELTRLQAGQLKMTSRCGIYRLIWHRTQGHVRRFFDGPQRDYLEPEGYDEFFTADPRPYSIMQRLTVGA